MLLLAKYCTFKRGGKETLGSGLVTTIQYRRETVVAHHSVLQVLKLKSLPR